MDSGCHISGTFGDTPTSLLPNGKILAGAPFSDSSYLYDPTNNTWTFAATKLRGDVSVEESWVQLPGGNVLSYDIWSDGLSAQYYEVATNRWIDTGPVPISLTASSEIGAGLQLADGRIFQVGATNQTAFYDPQTNTWEAGPTMPVGIGSDDAPAAALPNGHIIFVADTPNFQAPSRIYDYDPRHNSLVDITPSNAGINIPAFRTRLLVLPNGHVLMSTGSASISEYAPDGTFAESLRPTISDIASIGGLTYLLTGTRLNGYSEGAAYGDDAQMSSNYPIVQLTNSSGAVFYARSFDWTPGLNTDDHVVTTKFTLPSTLPVDNYQLRVIANGIPSVTANFSTRPGPSVLVATPGEGSTLGTATSSFTVKFNTDIDTSTLRATDWRVNGFPADTVTYAASSRTATFAYSSSPIAGEGLQQFQLLPGILADQSGNLVTAYGGSFRYDRHPLEVLDYSMPLGSGWVAGTLQELVVDFSEPLDPTSVGIQNLTTNLGTVVSATLQASGTSVRYAIQTRTDEVNGFVSLNTQTVRDRFGNAMVYGRSFESFTDKGLRTTLPSMQSTSLLGAGVYSSTIAGNIRSSTDTDGFALQLEKGQVLSAHLHTEITGGLQLGVRALSPSGRVLITSLADLDGDDIFMSAVRATESGEYRIEVFSINNTDGFYELTPYINADIETEFYFLGHENSTPESAQDLTPALVNVGNDRSLGSQAAIIGENFDSSETQVAYFGFDGGPDGFTINNVSEYADLGLWHITDRRGEELGHSSLNSFYYGSDLTGNYETTDANKGSITSSPFKLPPHGPIRLTFNTILQTENLLDFDEASIEVSSDGGLTFATIASSATGQLPQATDWTSVSVDVSSYAGKSIQLRFTFDTKDSADNIHEGWYIDDIQLVGEGDWSDYYSIELAAGQTLDAVVKSTSGDVVRVDVEDANGQVLSAGRSDVANADSQARGFTAITHGTYYVRVSADLAATYVLLVTRDANFESEINNIGSLATPLVSGHTMLGYAVPENGLSLNFETAAQGVVVNNNILGTGSSAGLWHLTTRRGGEVGHSGLASFYYGSETTGTYNTGLRNSGSITTDIMHVPSNSPQLSFNYVLRTQGLLALDRATVSISKDNFATSEILLLGGSSTMPFSTAWRSLVLELGRFANQDVKLRFTFDTVNALNNNFEGWYVDDIDISNGDKPDWYSFTLGADQQAVSILTRTPGANSQVGNQLNPLLELYDGLGTTLIARGTIQPDGRNELLSVGGLTPGAKYTVKIAGEGSTRGDYLLDSLLLRDPQISDQVDDTLARTKNSTGSFEVSRDPDKGWTRVVDPRGHEGDYTIHSVHANSGGGNYAEWTLPAPAAKVELFISWVALPGNATNATYEIFKDSNRIGVVMLDQNLAPKDALIDGKTLAASLGVFELRDWKPGMRLSVRLIAHDANGNIVADGLFVQPMVNTAQTADMNGIASRHNDTTLARIDSALEQLVFDTPSTLPLVPAASDLEFSNELVLDSIELITAAQHSESEELKLTRRPRIQFGIR